MNCGIYWIQLSDKHYYVGSSKDIKGRLSTHLRRLKKGYHTNRFMQSVFNMHKTFEAKTVLICDKDNLLFYEQILIDLHYGKEGCCNLSDNATSGKWPAIPWNKGKKASEETKKKLSEAQKQRTTWPWSGKKRGQTSEETKRKLSESVKLAKQNKRLKNEPERA